jgi:polyphenol oxidase
VNVPAPFVLSGDHVAARLPGGKVLFTTRRGGVSEGPYESLNLGLWTDDEPARVIENRERVAAAAGLERERLAQGRQVHGSDVQRLTEPPPRRAITGPASRAAPEPSGRTPEPSGRTPEPADGQATSARGLAPVVLTADCLPVALVAPEAVAMLHCGWRGLAGSIVAEGVAALRELGAAGRVAAAIGPGAGGCCYEVGEEIHAAFAHYGAAVRDGRRLDLKAVARLELEGAGVDEVHDTGMCTLCGDPALFFSHRRDGGTTGRQAGLAWRS